MVRELRWRVTGESSVLGEPEAVSLQSKMHYDKGELSSKAAFGRGWASWRFAKTVLGASTHPKRGIVHSPYLSINDYRRLRPLIPGPTVAWSFQDHRLVLKAERGAARLYAQDFSSSKLFDLLGSVCPSIIPILHWHLLS